MRKVSFWAVVALLLWALAFEVLAAPGNVFLVESYFRQSRYDKALESMEGLSVLSPRLLMLKARCLHGLDKPGDALTVLNELITSHKRSSYAARARHLILQILEENRDWEAEIKQLRSYLSSEKGKQAATWRRLLAYTLLRVGRPEEAIKELAMASSPADLRTLLDVLKESGQWQGFIEREGRQTQDKNRRRRLADLLFFNGDHAAARTHYEALVKEGMSDDVLLGRLLDTLEALSMKKEALEVLLKLVKSHPFDVGYHQRLGDVFFALGKLDEAIASWRKIVELNNRDPHAYTSLAAVLSDHRLLPQALAILHEGQSVLGRSNLFIEEMVKILGDLGRFEDGAELLIPLAVTEGELASEQMVKLASLSAKARSDCIKMLRAAIASYPSVNDYYLILDAVMAATGSTAALRKEIVESIISNYQSQPDGLRTIAAEFRQRERNTLALPLLRYVDGKIKGPQRVFNLMDLAEVENALGRWNSALAHLSEIASTAGAPSMLVEKAHKMKGYILHHSLRTLEAARKHWLALAQSTGAREDNFYYRLEAARAAIELFLFEDAGKELKKLSSLASSGFKAAVLFEMGRLAALEGHFDEALEHCSRSLNEDPEGESALSALELQLFMTANLPPDGLPEQVTKEVYGHLVRYLQLKTLLDVRAMARYDKQIASLKPEHIPPGLMDEYLMLEARSAHIRGDDRAESIALERIRKEQPKSPYRDGALIRLARILSKDKTKTKQATEVLEDHLLTYPESLQADEARNLLRKLKGATKRTGDQ